MTRMERFGERPALQRGDRVVVHEPGITHRAGVVGAVKPSHVSGWYVEVAYDIDGMTRAIPARHVVPEPPGTGVSGPQDGQDRLFR